MRVMKSPRSKRMSCCDWLFDIKAKGRNSYSFLDFLDLFTGWYQRRETQTIKQERRDGIAWSNIGMIE